MMNEVVRRFLETRRGMWCALELTSTVVLVGKLVECSSDGALLCAPDGRAFAVSGNLIQIAFDPSNVEELERATERESH